MDWMAARWCESRLRYTAEHHASKTGAQDRHTFCDSEWPPRWRITYSGSSDNLQWKLRQHRQIGYVDAICIGGDFARGGNDLEEGRDDVAVGMGLGQWGCETRLSLSNVSSGAVCVRRLETSDILLCRARHKINMNAQSCVGSFGSVSTFPT
jgi:hypothetical protein